MRDLEDLAHRAGAPDGVTWLKQMAAKMRYAIRCDPKGQVTARLDDDRWLADCPFCAGAEMVSRTSQVFFCLSCGLARNDGHVMAVVFPPEV